MTEALTRDYQICEEIGRGRFGVVRRCEPLDPSAAPSSSSSLAVKSIDKSAVSGDDLDSHCLLTEPKVLSLLSPHPNLLRIHNAYEDSSHLHLVLDLCDSPDLHCAVASAGPLPEPEAARILAQLMRAVAHCHCHGVVHRDIKPDNILFDSRGRLRLADFGSAGVIGGDPAAAVLRGVVGTPYYVAPEVVAGREYGDKVDVWSAGVVLYVMLAGFPPFHGESAEEIFGAVLRANLRFPPRVFRSVSPAAKDLLKKMLCRDASRRLSADQVLRFAHELKTSSRYFRVRPWWFGRNRCKQTHRLCSVMRKKLNEHSNFKNRSQQWIPPWMYSSELENRISPFRDSQAVLVSLIDSLS